MAGSAVSRIELPRATPVAAPAPESRARVRPPRSAPNSATPSRQLLVTLASRKWIILLFAVVGGILAALAGITRPTMYEATSQLIIDAPARAALPASPGSAQDMIDSSIDDHITMLSSESHLRRVAAALRQPSPANATAQPQAGKGSSSQGPTPADPPTSHSFAGDLLKRLWPRDVVSTNAPQAAEAAEMKALRKGVRVGQELRSRVISVGFSDDDPARAAMVANTFTKIYVDDLAQKSQASNMQELDAVVASLPKLQNELVDASNRLEEYRLSHGAVDQGSADKVAGERADLSQQISMSKADLAALESRLQRIQELRKQGAPAATLAEAAGTQELADLSARVARAPADKDLANAFSVAIEKVIADIVAEADIYRAQVEALGNRMRVLDAVAADTASRLAGLRALEPQVSLLTQRYNELLGRQQDLKRRIGAPSAGVSVLSVAWPPTIPQTLPPVFLVPPGMIAFGLLGAVLVLMRNRFDRTLRGEAEAEAVLRIPCVGLVPEPGRMHAKQLRDLVLGQPKSAYSRAVTSLLVAAAPNQARGRAPHTILLTPSVRADGATELAWGLALAATRLGNRVLLVDLQRAGSQLTPEFLRQFNGPKARHSFADYISSRCTLDDAVASIPEIGIDLTTMAPAEDLLALLARVDTAKCREDLHSAYSLVIINGPSGLAGPEAMFLKSWADAVLVTVRWARTSRHVARGVVEQLLSDGTLSVPVASVLTRVNLTRYGRYRFGDSADLLRERIS
ncbi:GumC family protein [Mesorhizobium sp. CO1-1-9]|uniref:GumC family protein n=1 Tax=Mesorhizobium sp. CO1-1-9 TaxID=2876630 RepID=UPI00398C7FE5